jgi:predicted lipoprotein with Yx(FWY)xxD motif
MNSPSPVWALTATVLLTGTLTACGGDTPADAEQTPMGSSTAAASASPGSSTAQDSTVMTARSDLGTILVDGAGMTLYLFTGDTRDSGKSACEGECIGAWPPLLGEPRAVKGANESLAGTIERNDGTIQATYNGWPLYHWTQDSAPGDTTGQGVSQAWWVLDANGDPIGAS